MLYWNFLKCFIFYVIFDGEFILLYIFCIIIFVRYLLMFLIKRGDMLKKKFVIFFFILFLNVFCCEIL